MTIKSSILRPVYRACASPVADSDYGIRAVQTPEWPVDMTSLQTWTPVNKPAGYNAARPDFLSLVDAPGMMLAGLYLDSGVTPSIDTLYSTDNGASWNLANRAARTNSYSPQYCYAASLGKWIAHSFLNNSDWDIVASESVDGINWSAPVGTFLDGSPAGDTIVKGHNGQQFIGIGGYTGRLCVSADGVHWESSAPLPVPYPALANYGAVNRVCWVEGIQKWLAAFYQWDATYTNFLGTTLYISDDGLEWEAVPLANLPAGFSGAYLNCAAVVPAGMPIILADFTNILDKTIERIYASWDATNWVVVHEATVPAWKMAGTPRYYDGGVVVVGDLRVLKSPDGFRWGAASVAQPSSISGVTTANWYAVATNYASGTPIGFYRAEI